MISCGSKSNIRRDILANFYQMITVDLGIAASRSMVCHSGKLTLALVFIGILFFATYPQKIKWWISSTNEWLALGNGIGLLEKYLKNEFDSMIARKIECKLQYVKQSRYHSVEKGHSTHSAALFEYNPWIFKFSWCTCADKVIIFVTLSVITLAVLSGHPPVLGGTDTLATVTGTCNMPKYMRESSIPSLFCCN